ncbi:MAG: glycosyltransferase [Anaerotignaceae bacterium]
MLQPYTVILSVYSGEKAEFLKKSIDSIVNQTVKPDEFLIICDGPLTEELDKLLFEFEKENPNLFTIHRLETNMGTGYAANIGLKLCKNQLIAKMDSDDIAYSNRCEIQLKEFEKNPQIDMIGGFVSEFEGTPENEMAVKKVPLSHEEILTFAKRRNPFNNQTLMYKKDKAISCGGYTCNTRCEDYDFIVKMILDGAICKNLNQPLVHYRLDGGAYERRRNWKNTKGFIGVRYKNWRRGFSSFMDFLLPCIAQLILFVLPVGITKKFYIKYLR